MRQPSACRVPVKFEARADGQDRTIARALRRRPLISGRIGCSSSDLQCSQSASQPAVALTYYPHRSVPVCMQKSTLVLLPALFDDLFLVAHCPTAAVAAAAAALVTVMLDIASD